MEERITLNTEYIKLDALLKFSATVGSGGQAKELVLSGGVIVNGVTATERGKKIRPGDRVQIGETTLLVE